jgi:metallo-beta-lactamase class B
MAYVLSVLVALTVVGAMASQIPLFDPPIDCGLCAEWNARREPLCIFGNTYYVGVAGLSAILVISADGHILLDGGLPQV